MFKEINVTWFIYYKVNKFILDDSTIYPVVMTM